MKLKEEWSHEGAAGGGAMEGGAQRRTGIPADRVGATPARCARELVSLRELRLYFWLINLLLVLSALGIMNTAPCSTLVCVHEHVHERSRGLMCDSILQLKKILLRPFDVTEQNFCSTRREVSE